MSNIYSAKEKNRKRQYILVKCSKCQKNCVPAAYIKPKGEKERCYCDKCYKELIKPTEF